LFLVVASRIELFCPLTANHTRSFSFYGSCKLHSPVFTLAVDQSTDSQLISHLTYNQLNFHTFRVSPLHVILWFYARPLLQKCTTATYRVKEVRVRARVQLRGNIGHHPYVCAFIEYWPRRKCTLDENKATGPCYNFSCTNTSACYNYHPFFKVTFQHLTNGQRLAREGTSRKTKAHR